MGQQPQKLPQQPEPTLKQQVKQYTGSINQMRRQFQKQKFKIDCNKKTLEKQLRKKIQKKEPIASQKTIGQQVLKQNQMVAKYDKLDTQLQNVSFELQQMCVNQSMKNVMQGMAKIMQGANQKMGNKNFQQTIKKFMTEKQKMAIMNEMAQDMMDGDEQEIEDEDVDKLIGEMTKQEVAKKQKKIQQNMDLDDYQNQLGDI